jgi:hypothetical protein
MIAYTLGYGVKVEWVGLFSKPNPCPRRITGCDSALLKYHKLHQPTLRGKDAVKGILCHEPGHPGFPKTKIGIPPKRAHTCWAPPEGYKAPNVFQNHRECVEERAPCRAEQCKSRRDAIDCGQVSGETACLNQKLIKMRRELW